jgi:hypothetical protein
MPFRSRATLEQWLAEFAELGYPRVGTLRVIEQDGDAGANTGLIALDLDNAATSVFLQPIVQGSPSWVVTFESREDAIVLDPAQVSGLAAELSIVSALCAFLQAKASSFTAPG